MYLAWLSSSALVRPAAAGSRGLMGWGTTRPGAGGDRDVEDWGRGYAAIASGSLPPTSETFVWKNINIVKKTFAFLCRCGGHEK